MKIREEYNKNGFVKIPNFLPQEILDQIRSNCKDFFLRQIRRNKIQVDGDSESDFEKVLYEVCRVDYAGFIGAAKLCQHQIDLFVFSGHSTITSALRDLGLEKPTICVKPIVYFNSPHIAKQEGHFKTPAHQDWRSMQGSINSTVVWIPLINIDKDLGALEVIPGSHHWGLVDSEKDEWYRKLNSEKIKEESWKSLEVSKGDMVCFHSLLVHRSGNNVSGKIRWSMHFRYNDAYESTFINRAYPHPYIVYQPGQELLFPDFNPGEELKKYLDGL
jgi:phytanoyl-CoA hydroxylase